MTSRTLLNEVCERRDVNNSHNYITLYTVIKIYTVNFESLHIKMGFFFKFNLEGNKFILKIILNKYKL